MPRPKNHSLLANVWFLGLGPPGLQKNTWPTKTLRDASESKLEHLFRGGPSPPCAECLGWLALLDVPVVRGAVDAPDCWAVRCKLLKA